jgi:hypothetical protein
VLLGNANNISKNWNMERQNTTAGHNISQFQISESPQLSPSQPFSGAGFVLHGGELPFIAGATCNISNEIYPEPCAGLVISAAVISGYYLSPLSPHSSLSPCLLVPLSPLAYVFS